MIELEDVHRTYGARPAVAGLSFRVEHGECVGLLGLNGAGKSTTLRMLAGVSLPTRGVVRVEGAVLSPSSHDVRARIGYLPDRPPVYEEMSVRRYLAFAARLRGWGKRDAHTRLEQVLEVCGLTRVADDTITTLSHGFRQRVGIAQAIVHRPRVLVLDEPSQGLDPAQNLEMRALVRSLAREHTVILSTHLLADIRECCDRILVMHEGKLLADGPEREIVDRFTSQRGARVMVLVRGERAELDAVLAQLAEVRVVRITQADGALSLELEAERDVRGELSRALVNAGLTLLELRAEARGLERLFVELGKERT